MSADHGTVLYDALGPRGKRRVRIGSVFALVVALAVVWVVVQRLAEQQQFAADKWSVLFNPGDENFTLLWKLLLEGLWLTVTAAALAVVFSLIFGTVLGMTRMVAARWYRWAIVGAVELLRGVPVVIAIFFAARVLPDLGVRLSLLWYVVIGLTVYNSVVIAEILRAGVNSLPKGQTEAAYAIGLTRGQTLRMILLPQAFRIMLPALISQLVVVVKDTSLGFIISYQELVRTANIAIQSTKNPLQMYLVVAMIFIAINYSLGKLAEYTQRRLARSRAGGAAPVEGGMGELDPGAVRV